MKSKSFFWIFIIIANYSLLISNCFAQDWEWLNPKPTGTPSSDVKFLNKDTGWAVGGFGTIVKTIDGGASWKLKKSGTFQELSSICILSKNKLIAFGHGDSMLVSMDQGESWTKKLTLLYDITSACFPDSLTGYAIDVIGVVVMTKDGGITWEVSTDTGGDLSQVYFINKNKGFLIGDYGVIYMTEDGGYNWNFIETDFAWGVTTDEVMLYSASFGDSLTGYITGLNYDKGYRFIIKTTDGGLHWFLQYKYYTLDLGLSNLFFTSAQTGYSLGYGIFKTIDGGITWEKQTGDVYVSFYFTDSINGYAIGWNTAVTHNGGVDWKIYEKGFRDDLYSVCFPDSMTGFVGGGGDYSGIIAKTTDGGDTWQVVYNDSTSSVNSISFTDLQIGFASVNRLIAGNQGKILKTVDGGNNWKIITKSDSIAYTALTFTSKDTGYVIGAYHNEKNPAIGDELILKTIDGGNNWNVIYHNSEIRPNKLYFKNSLIGYCVGADNNGGLILKTKDGGLNWVAQNCYKSTVNYSIFFIDSLKGFCVSGFNFSAGAIQKTINGGKNWELKPTQQISSLNSIAFSDSLTGYAVGNYGTVLRTKDGGETWDKVHFPGGTYNSIVYSNPHTAYIIGSAGAILRNRNAGGIFTKSNKIQTLHNVFKTTIYPNPISDNSSIFYSIPVKTRVNIDICDITGQHTLKLLDKVQDKGDYCIKINAKNLQDGLYFCQILLGCQSRIVKIVVLK